MSQSPPTGRSRARHRQTTGGQGIARESDSPKPIHAQGENAQAVDLHRQAVALFDALGNISEVARTLSGSIQPLLLTGEYNRAFAISSVQPVGRARQEHGRVHAPLLPPLERREREAGCSPRRHAGFEA